MPVLQALVSGVFFWQPPRWENCYIKTNLLAAENGCTAISPPFNHEQKHGIGQLC